MADRVKSKLYSTVRWQHMRRLALARSHLCMYCFKNPSNTVDHLSGCTDDNRAENHIPCCDSCHSKKTMRIDVICRLINMQTFHDALVFAARRSMHDFLVPEHVLEAWRESEPSIWPGGRYCNGIYESLRLNSLNRPEGITVQGSIDDIRYVIVVNELHRIGHTSDRNYRKQRYTRK